MHKLKFERWCRAATAQIRFVPDRMPVIRELLGHMEDHYQDLLAGGTDPKEAVDETITAMGPPEAIAPQLAALHKPFWGYTERIIRWILIALLGISLSSFGFFVLKNSFFDPPEYFPDTYARYSEDSEVTLYLEPGDFAISDGYIISLSKVVWEDSFRFQIKAFSLFPWAEHSDIGRWFEVTDSLGNTYRRAYESGWPGEPAVMGSHLRTGPNTSVNNMWLTNFCSQDAQWIAFRYERSGRTITFRIDLTGGGA